MTSNRVVLAAAGACGLALLAWLLTGPARPSMPGAAPTAAASEPGRPAVAEPRVAATPVAATASVPRAAPSAVADACEADAPVAASEPAADDPDDVDAPAAASTPASAGRPPSARFATATQRIDAALRTSADPYARAVGIWLDLTDADAGDTRKRRLVQLARESADPRLYALAFRSCTDTRRDVCANLSARRWAEVDPGNGMPWLYAMDEASRRGDGGGVAEALFRMSTAARIDARFFQPAAVVLEAAGSDEGSLSAGHAAIARAQGMAAAQVEPWTVVVQACGADKVHADANLAQTCRAIGRLWQDHSDTLLSRMLGSAIEFRVTGDASRRDALRAESMALTAHWPTSDGTSCRQLRANLRYYALAARVGELAAARQLAGSAPAAPMPAAAATSRPSTRRRRRPGPAAACARCRAVPR